VDTIGQNVLEAVDLVLCLDSIGGWGGQRLEAAAGQRAAAEAGLTLHVSNAEGANQPPHQLWDELSAVAGEVRPLLTVGAVGCLSSE
jgi:hypothetical protein